MNWVIALFIAIYIVCGIATFALTIEECHLPILCVLLWPIVLAVEIVREICDIAKSIVKYIKGLF